MAGPDRRAAHRREQLRVEARLARLAMSDPLTELSNRAAIEHLFGVEAEIAGGDIGQHDRQIALESPPLERLSRCERGLRPEERVTGQGPI